jgi:hypothetical protein
MNKGLLVQSVIVILIVVASTIIVVVFINSLLQESRERQDFNRAKALMLNLDNFIRGLLLESSGARRDIRLLVDYGTFTVAGSENKIKSILEVESDIIEQGVTIREGNLEIISGGGISASEKDIDGDGTTDLVLENEALVFAVRKLGSSGNLTSINASTIVTRMENKLAGNVVAIPEMKFFIEEADSSAGNGYSELSRQGSNLPSASIRIYIEPELGVNYEAIFTLTSRKDFIDVRMNLLE